MSIFKSNIDAMSAYKPPLEGRDNKRYTLLDFNERTIDVPEYVRVALHEFIDSGRLQMYPSYADITDKIAAYCGLSSSQVMITNGSDQGIDLVFRAACRAGDEAIIPGPSFAMYTQCAKVEGLVVHEPEYSLEEGFPLQAVMSAISPATRIIVVSNPNNPSGTLLSKARVLEIARHAPHAVILVDECYFEYCGETVASCLDECPNVVVTRTFSKTWGLPSVRFGYVLSCAENINALLNVRGPYDVNQFAVAAVNAALERPEVTLAYVNEVMRESKPLLEGFLDRRQVAYWPSSANFIWMFPEEPESLNQCLQQAGILVRPKQDALGRLGLRVTLGTLEQTQRLIQVLGAALDK